jgi:hypothetical protein
MMQPSVALRTGRDSSEHHRDRAEAHGRAAQSARTAGERRMQEDLADLHARLAALAHPRLGR